jgi:hypothetical protein
MRTLNEMNKPFHQENELSEIRLKLITLDRRLRHLSRTKPKNGLERFGMWLQRVGIRMQIKGVLQRMKTQNGKVR